MDGRDEDSAVAYLDESAGQSSDPDGAVGGEGQADDVVAGHALASGEGDDVALLKEVETFSGSDPDGLAGAQSNGGNFSGVERSGKRRQGAVGESEEAL